MVARVNAFCRVAPGQGRTAGNQTSHPSCGPPVLTRRDPDTCRWPGVACMLVSPEDGGSTERSLTETGWRGCSWPCAGPPGLPPRVKDGRILPSPAVGCPDSQWGAPRQTQWHTCATGVGTDPAPTGTGAWHVAAPSKDVLADSDMGTVCYALTLRPRDRHWADGVHPASQGGRESRARRASGAQNGQPPSEHRGAGRS